MIKEELLKIIQELPDGCSIGVIDSEYRRVESNIEVLTNKDKVFSNGKELTIKELEETLNSNKDYICDYYIHY